MVSMDNRGPKRSRQHRVIAALIAVVTLLIYQNCAVYQSDARRILDTQGLGALSVGPNGCLPYLSAGEAAAIMDPLKGTPDMTLFTDGGGNPSCLITQAQGVGVDKIQCSISTAGKNALSSNAGLTADSGVPSTFGGKGFYSTVTGGSSQIFFQYLGAQSASSLGVSCVAVFADQNSYTAGSATILIRSRLFMMAIAGRLK